MEKAVIVKKNRVKKIIVAQHLGYVKLQPGESVHKIERPIMVGDKFESAWTRFLKLFKAKK
jgi:hypothetical protein